MSNPSDDIDPVADETLIIVGLMLLQEMLFMSNYPDDVKAKMKERVGMLIAKIQRRYSNVDAYGNPYD